MATRMAFRPVPRAFPKSTTFTTPALRTFKTTRALQANATPVPIPVRKPVGAFRGGMLGFFMGASLAGAGVYYYILDEYRVSNQMLSEDIYSLRAAVQRTEQYVRALEDRVVQMQTARAQGK